MASRPTGSFRLGSLFRVISAIGEGRAYIKYRPNTPVLSFNHCFSLFYFGSADQQPIV